MMILRGKYIGRKTGKKTHVVGDNKKNPTTSLISSATSLISSVAQCSPKAELSTPIVNNPFLLAA